MKTFIVYAHAEPRSFNGALFQTAQETLRAAGHTVVASDLYAMKFDPVSDRRNFTTVKNPWEHDAGPEGVASLTDVEEQRLAQSHHLGVQFELESDSFQRNVPGA